LRARYEQESKGLKQCVKNNSHEDESDDAVSDIEADEALSELEADGAVSEIEEAAMQQRKSFPNVSRAADRFNLSDRSVSAIAIALLQDFNIVNKDDQSNVIDRSKIRREREQC
jgi:hypothetical protein